MYSTCTCTYTYMYIHLQCTCTLYVELCTCNSIIIVIQYMNMYMYNVHLYMFMHMCMYMNQYNTCSLTSHWIHVCIIACICTCTYEFTYMYMYYKYKSSLRWHQGNYLITVIINVQVTSSFIHSHCWSEILKTKAKRLKCLPMVQFSVIYMFCFGFFNSLYMYILLVLHVHSEMLITCTSQACI